jgi:hypothetical protein
MGMNKETVHKGAAMGDDCEQFWSTLPERVLHSVRVPIVEALWWIGEPLSVIELVDVLDGFLSMWGAAYHLRVLDALDVVEPSSVDADSGASGEDRFDLPYRLKDRDSGEGA